MDMDDAGKTGHDDDTNDQRHDDIDAGAKKTGADAGNQNDDGDDEGGDDAGKQAEIEARARRLGWVPESEWRGSKPPKGGFMEAEEYIARGEQVLSLSLARGRKLESELAASERSNKELKDTLAETNRRIDEMSGVVRTLHEQSVAVGKRAYEKARADLRAEMLEAAKEANPERVQQIQEQLDQLDKDKPTDPPPKKKADTDDEGGDESRARQQTPKKSGDEAPKFPPQIEEWVGKNSWFNRDTVLRARAIELHGEDIAAGKSIDESLDDLTDRLREEFPTRFENGERRRPSAVVRPRGGGDPPKKKKTFADLPADAKAAFAAIKHTDPKYTEEKYLADYQWDA